jgi:hemoglobin-like flavoprotein
MLCANLISNCAYLRKKQLVQSRLLLGPSRRKISANNRLCVSMSILHRLEDFIGENQIYVQLESWTNNYWSMARIVYQVSTKQTFTLSNELHACP